MYKYLSLLLLTLIFAACAPAAETPVAGTDVTLPPQVREMSRTAEGTWTGISIGNDEVPTRLVVRQTGFVLTGNAFFNTGNGFEYYGDFQGVAQEVEPGVLRASIIILYPDIGEGFSYTAYQGTFRGNRFSANYHFVDAMGFVRDSGSANFTLGNP